MRIVFNFFWTSLLTLVFIQSAAYSKGIVAVDISCQLEYVSVVQFEKNSLELATSIENFDLAVDREVLNTMGDFVYRGSAELVVDHRALLVSIEIGLRELGDIPPMAAKTSNELFVKLVGDMGLIDTGSDRKVNKDTLSVSVSDYLHYSQILTNIRGLTEMSKQELERYIHHNAPKKLQAGNIISYNISCMMPPVLAL